MTYFIYEIHSKNVTIKSMYIVLSSFNYWRVFVLLYELLIEDGVLHHSANSFQFELNVNPNRRFWEDFRPTTITIIRCGRFSCRRWLRLPVVRVQLNILFGFLLGLVGFKASKYSFQFERARTLICDFEQIFAHLCSPLSAVQVAARRLQIAAEYCSFFSCECKLLFDFQIYFKYCFKLSTLFDTCSLIGVFSQPPVELGAATV